MDAGVLRGLKTALDRRNEQSGRWWKDSGAALRSGGLPPAPADPSGCGSGLIRPTRQCSALRAERRTPWTAGAFSHFQAAQNTPRTYRSFRRERPRSGGTRASGTGNDPRGSLGSLEPATTLLTNGELERPVAQGRPVDSDGRRVCWAPECAQPFGRASGASEGEAPTPGRGLRVLPAPSLTPRTARAAPDYVSNRKGAAPATVGSRRSLCPDRARAREMPLRTFPPLEHRWPWRRCSGPQVKRIGVVTFKTAHGIDRAESK